MAPLDFVVIIAYLGIVIAVNQYWASRVAFADWLTSKNTIGWRFLTFTVVSTNVGAGTILGTAGSTFHHGIGWGLTGGVGAMLGYWIMAMLTRRIRQITSAGNRSSFQEFFRQRYSRLVQAAVGVIVAFLYFFYLAAQFKGLGAILEVWGGWSAQGAALFAALLVVWLTASAGIRSDMYTDVLHFWAMLLTILAAAGLEVWKLGGFGALAATLAAQGAWAGLVDPYAFAGATYVWIGMGVGMWLGLPSMEVWQRVDAARGRRDAAVAFWVSGVLNAVFFAAAILLGFVARAVLSGDIPKNHVLFELVRHTLPPGLVGLAVVGAFAAFMSTANSMLMVSVASLLGDLLYVREARLNRKRGILTVTRWLTWGTGLAGFFIARYQPDIVSLILNALWGSGVLLPAILGGLFWKRATNAGAFWSIAAGFTFTTLLAIGSFRTGVLFPLLGGAPDAAWQSWWEQNYWMPGLAATALIFVGLSLVTRHARSERLRLAV